MRRMLILVAALALLTTACKIQINAEFTINADKSGAVVLELGYDDEIKELAESSGESPDSMFGDFDIEDVAGRGGHHRAPRRHDLPDRHGADRRHHRRRGPRRRDGRRPHRQLRDHLHRRPGDGAGSTTLDDALGGGGEDMAGIPPEMLSEFFEVNIRITMPGKILEHNATSQSGNTLTWAVNLTDPALDISAQSNPNASAAAAAASWSTSSSAAAVILLGLLLWMFMKKRGAAGWRRHRPRPPMAIGRRSPGTAAIGVARPRCDYVLIDLVPALLKWEGRDSLAVPDAADGALELVDDLYDDFRLAAVTDGDRPASDGPGGAGAARDGRLLRQHRDVLGVRPDGDPAGHQEDHLGDRRGRPRHRRHRPDRTGRRTRTGPASPWSEPTAISCGGRQGSPPDGLRPGQPVNTCTVISPSGPRITPMPDPVEIRRLDVGRDAPGCPSGRRGPPRRWPPAPGSRRRTGRGSRRPARRSPTDPVSGDRWAK